MSERKPKDAQPGFKPAAETESKSTTSSTESENPTYQLANGSEKVQEQKDIHDLANGTFSEEPLTSQSSLGNPEGALALTQTADKLDALMANEKTALLNLDESTKERYRFLSGVLRQYATENKAFLSTNKDDFPEGIMQKEKVVGQYDAKTDIIYLSQGPSNADAFNTIVHEISHAANKDSSDLARIKDFDEKWAKEENPSSEEYLLDLSDMLLSKVVYELEGEIDGEVLEIIEKNKSDSERSSGHKRNIDAWTGRTLKGGSSGTAYSDWKKTVTRLTNTEGSENAFKLDFIAYEARAKQYILEGGSDFPFIRSFPEKE